MPRKAQDKWTTAADGTVAIRGKAPNGASTAYSIAEGASRANWTDRSARLTMRPTPT